MTLERFDDQVQTARAKLLDKDAPAAARMLRFAAQAEGLDADDARLRTLCELFTQIGAQMGMEELETRAQAALSLGGQALYDLGYTFIEVGLPELAVPFLTRLLSMAPGDLGVVQELVAAYEHAGRHAQARDVLLAHPELLGEFWPRYLLCFNALSAGDLATAREHARVLTPSEDTETIAHTRITGMLERASLSEDRTALDLRDLRGWHYVLNGSLLLHRSPYGFNEGMNGRYAYTQDSAASMRRELGRLVEVLRARREVPAVVWAPEERGSQVTARALAQLLGGRAAPLDANSMPAPTDLVAIYDLDRLDPEALGIVAHHSSTRRFARCACWTSPPPLIPEYLGLLHQVMVAPWDASMRFTPDDGAREMPASTESADAWASRVAQSEVLEDEEGGPDFEPLADCLALATLPLRTSDLWFNGPVTSSRFG